MLCDGVRIKGVFRISDMKYNKSRGFWEYQLTDPNTDQPYKEGALFREKDLRFE
jgi:hypothetical protein